MAGQRPTPQPGKLVVRGYAPGTTDQELREWFGTFGPLEEVASPPDPVTRQPRGYTFVRFVNPADSDRAIKEMNGKEIQGHKLSVVQSLYAKGQGPARGGAAPRGGRDRPYGDPGRYDRPARESDRYDYDRRGRSRSPPGRGYDDYYRDRYYDQYYDDYYRGSYYDDYYGRDSPRERYPPPPRREYYDRYDERYPPPPRRYSDDSYYRDYSASTYDDYYEYDRGRRPPPPATETRERPPVGISSNMERRPAAESYADDRYDTNTMVARRPPGSTESSTAQSSNQQPVTYPMPSNYRL